MLAERTTRACSAIVFVRMSHMMLALLRRTIPLETCSSIPLAFAVYYVWVSAVHVARGTAAPALLLIFFPACNVAKLDAHLQEH
ncbi:MAG TPA: hypothetical protein VHW01_05920 [Polyangiaceae bacterium]|jgi:hypothetical protein|nr:hypothetical protein [Polyangiaceae bacterium]